MRFTEIFESLVHHLLARMMWRAIAALVAAVAALMTLYQLTAAGTIALEAHYGALHAHLIVAAVFGAASLAVVLTLWATRRKSPGVRDTAASAASSPRNSQILMLLEAAMLGFTAGKKTTKSV